MDRVLFCIEKEEFYNSLNETDREALKELVGRVEANLIEQSCDWIRQEGSCPSDVIGLQEHFHNYEV